MDRSSLQRIQQKVAYWRHTKGPDRVIGPLHDSFPNPRGWLLDGIKVDLDKISINTYTRALTMRKFKPSAAEVEWSRRLSTNLPWDLIWKIRPTFATPRDQIPGLKLLHRTLFTASQDSSCQDPSCRACPSRENQEHLADCPIIKLEFWDCIIDFLIKTGMDKPLNDHHLKISGTLSRRKTIDRHRASLWFIAWRCLYAATVASRIDHAPLDLEKAYKRAIALLHSRVRATGMKWQKWASIGYKHERQRLIPQNKLNKVFLDFQPTGEFSLSASFNDEMQRLFPGQFSP